jgi:hypothetical protein
MSALLTKTDMKVATRGYRLHFARRSFWGEEGEKIGFAGMMSAASAR